MQLAIEHFNRNCCDTAHPLTVQLVQEHPCGEAGVVEREVYYALTDSTEGSVLAYYVSRLAEWETDSYCEVTLNGFVVFRRSLRYQSHYMGPLASVCFYEHDLDTLSRAVSAGIPGSEDRIYELTQLKEEHIKPYLHFGHASDNTRNA